MKGGTDRRADGRTERTDGRRDGRTNGQTDGRTERTDGRKGGQASGRTRWRTDGQNGRPDGGTEGRTERTERTDDKPRAKEGAKYGKYICSPSAAARMRLKVINQRDAVQLVGTRFASFIMFAPLPQQEEGNQQLTALSLKASTQPADVDGRSDRSNASVSSRNKTLVGCSSSVSFTASVAEGKAAAVSRASSVEDSDVASPKCAPCADTSQRLKATCASGRMAEMAAASN